MSLHLLQVQREELVQNIYWYDSYYKIGKYNVSRMCIETNPCQHNVIDTKTGNIYTVSKSYIYLLCIWYWVDIPHFYPNWRRSRMLR